MSKNNKRAIVLAASLLALFALLANVASAEEAPPELPLMPYPAAVNYAEGELVLTEQLALTLIGDTSSLPDTTLTRFAQRLQKQTGQTVSSNKAAAGTPLVIDIERAISPVRNSAQLQTRHESYQLRIDHKGIHLHAATHLGVQHGLETLLQLLADGDRALPAMTIDDEPRFGWRGLMLDSVRHFFSVETIKRQLDGMAAAKLNIFHWHLTDDQGWRLESRAYPKLHEQASNGQYYTREQVQDIVAYASERGIQVMPEIDMPGHSSAIAVAYPALMSAPGPYQLEDRWGVHQPLLNPTNEAVYDFAEAILTEVAELFPFDYVHIGGDEVDPQHWQDSDEIQAFMQRRDLADAEALHAYFNRRVAAILTSLNRKMMGWDEVLHLDLPAATAVQSWRGADALGRAAQQGHPAVLSTGFYLDQPQSAGYHYRTRFIPQPLSADDTPTDGEVRQTWSFAMPRKRGAPVTGHLTLIEGPAHQHRAFIDFAGKSRREVQQLQLQGNRIGFTLDTWMGPLRARLERTADSLSGDVIVGNAAYALSGNKTDHSPPAIAKPVLSTADAANILGGEIALWSELIDEQSIDLRLWPRAFAVAERLWSPAARRDVDSLYRRLPGISRWAEESVGLQHRSQSASALQALVPQAQLAATQTLMEALEPAQYYHRHHEKSQRETYSRRDPLNRFVDTLPAESLAIRTLSQQIEQLLQTPDEALASAIASTLNRWQNSARRLIVALDAEGASAEIHRQAQRVATVTDWGLKLLPLWQQHRALSPSDRTAARASLREAQQIADEMVVSAAYALETLLDALPETPATVDWMPEDSFTTGIEGPVVGPDGSLYAVNFGNEGTLGKVSGQNRGELWVTLPAGSVANSLRFDSSGLLWAADYSGHNLIRLHPANGKILATHHEPRMHQPNDIAVTRWGAIFASDPDWATSRGQLWRMDPDGTFVLLETDMGTTNGIELSPDEQRLYVNESVQLRVWVYDVSATGELSNKRLFYQFDDYGLDGMATDPEGRLYIARYGAGVIAVLSDQGQLLETVQLQGRYPTNIALDLGEHPRAFVTLQQRGAIETFALDPHLSATRRPAPISELLSREQFDALFPERNPFYSYDGLLAASRQFPAFAGVGNLDTRKRELAAALANFAHETGNLVYVEEIHKSDYCSNTDTLCGTCAPGKRYFGRGPIQLSWNGNYCAAGLALGIDLWAEPERVAEDPAIAWQSALWYWLTRRGPGTMTSHRAMTDGRGFGETIRSINGRLECDGGNPGQVNSRIEKYRAISRFLEVDPGDNLGC